MKKAIVILIFTCDLWHTSDSKELIAIAPNKRAVLKLIKDYIKKHDLDELTDDDWMNLDKINQTQNYSEGFEFMLEHLVMYEIIE